MWARLTLVLLFMHWQRGQFNLADCAVAVLVTRGSVHEALRGHTGRYANIG